MTVNRTNVVAPQAVYAEFRDRGIHMKINPLTRSGLASADGADLGVTAEEYGRFLVRVFDAWFDDPDPRVTVDPFGQHLARILGDAATHSCFYTLSCHRYFLGVSPTGDLFPCGMFQGEPSFRYGNIHQISPEDVARTVLFGDITAREAAVLEQCSRCAFLDLCYGGCMFHSLKDSQVLAEKDYYCTATACTSSMCCVGYTPTWGGPCGSRHRSGRRWSRDRRRARRHRPSRVSSRAGLETRRTGAAAPAGEGGRLRWSRSSSRSSEFWGLRWGGPEQLARGPGGRGPGAGELRLKTYPPVWQRTAVVSRWPRTDASPRHLERLHRDLREWYYGVGGLYLSANARVRYEELQRVLEAYAGSDSTGTRLPDPIYTDVMQAASAFRTSLTEDLQSRQQRSLLWRSGWAGRTRSQKAAASGDWGRRRAPTTRSATSSRLRTRSCGCRVGSPPEGILIATGIRWPASPDRPRRTNTAAPPAAPPAATSATGSRGGFWLAPDPLVVRVLPRFAMPLIARCLAEVPVDLTQSGGSE